MRVLIALLLVAPCFASIANVYIAQDGDDGNAGDSCVSGHPKAATFFNTAGNWDATGADAAKIGPDTIAHLCGTWTGGDATKFLTFQASGTSGHVITLLFETGAKLQPNYCHSTGCIDLNGQSYLLIDGGVTCGETARWSTTACNGEIVNQLAGSTGATCPGGACSPLAHDTRSFGIGSASGSPTNIEIRNLRIHLYVHLASDTIGNTGMSAYGIGLAGGTRAQAITIHNMMFDGMAKAVLISLGSVGSGTLSGYEVYNSNFTDQCWAMGVGVGDMDTNLTGLQFHDNEVSNWDNWAPVNDTSEEVRNDVCHTNGTQWFNAGTPSGGYGYIGDSTSAIYNNYLHGDLSGGVLGSSPSGHISCQDNCIDIAVFNNLVVDGCTGTSPTRACTGPLYFNGPGGGGQKVYNNTFIGSGAGNCLDVRGSTNPVTIKNNICTSYTNFIKIRQTSIDGYVVSDNNDVYDLGNPNAWTWNYYAPQSYRTWAQQKEAGQDVNSITDNPALDASYKPTVGSPVIRLGENLTSEGITALNADLLGVARPGADRWGAGARQYTPGYSVLTSGGIETGRRK